MLRVAYDKSGATGCNTVSGGGTVVTGTDDTVRTTLKQIVDDFSPGGWTPLVDTYYEAAQYFRGGNVLYGKGRGNQTTYGRLSHPASYSGGTLVRNANCTDSSLNSSACANEHIDGSPIYASPVADSCQTNHIVLLTDGRANNNNSTGLISSLTGACAAADTGEACGRDLADWLANNDQSALSGEQTVTTHTIAFNLVDGFAIDFLEDVAAAGDGSYQSANTATELLDAFNNILSDVAEVDSSFVSPGATVDMSNRLRHRNEVYFSLFKPNDTPKWAGNLKAYKVDGSSGTIVDSAGNAAVNPVNGSFKDTAQSFWSDSVDGNDVTLGGAAGELTLTGRKVFTYTGTNVNLSDTSNALHESNAAVTDAMLGIDGTVNKSNLLQWARGVDVLDVDGDGSSTEVRQQMGDPLHSRPAIISYDVTATPPDTTVFFGTNEGYLHAIDGATGVEKFAFVPQELLPNLNVFYDNRSSNRHPYGLDGPITAWVKDEGITGKIEAGDHVYLYAGMRRGGRNLYALDVTDRGAPTLKWTINGGTTTGFAELGQTWSKPILTNVNISGTKKEVLVFAGGYDPDQDTYSTRSGDDMGRAIFMVNPNDGSLVWSGGPDGSHNETFVDMLYSIPSDIRVVDMDVDGLADQLYVGDMGGQVWRFDINNGGALAGLVQGGVIARVSDTTFAGNRRFFYAPDVSVAVLDGEKFLSVAIGSGWRAHPLNTTIEDRFYMFKQEAVFEAPTSYTVLTHADLHDATDNLIQDSDSTKSEAAINDLAGKDGWWMGFSTAGEKVLAESLTLDNKVIFSSYVPGSGGSTCAADVGTGHVYAVSLFDATPVEDLDESGGNLTTGDRMVNLERDGIPPEPVVLFPSPGKPIVLVGSEQPINQPLDNPIERTFWRQEPSN